MKYEILGASAYSTLHLVLNKGEQIKSEPGAMVAMDSTAEIDGKMEGGLLAGLGRKFLTGESFFVTTITATQDKTDVYLAPRSVGDVKRINLDGETDLIVQGGGFLASTTGIETDSKFQGLKGFFSGEGLFMIRAKGKGICFVSSFGAIIEYTITPEKGSFIVDNAHIVAFDANLDYTIEKAGNGLFTAVKTGEGLVTKFSGSGKIYIQTRNVGSFVETLNPFISVPDNSGGNSSLLGGFFGD